MTDIELLDLAIDVANTLLAAEQARDGLSAACSTGDTTKSGALTAAAKRELEATHPRLVGRLQDAETAHTAALDAFRKAVKG